MSFLFWGVGDRGRRDGPAWPIGLICPPLQVLYPIFVMLLRADSGLPVSPSQTAIYSCQWSRESVMGIPATGVRLTWLIGFLLFGVCRLQQNRVVSSYPTGVSLLRSVRGGPGQVAVFSSGLMGL